MAEHLTAVGLEGRQRGGVRLVDVGGAVHGVVEHHQRSGALRLGACRHPGSGQQIGWSVGRDLGRPPHRPSEDQRGGKIPDAVRQEGCFLQGVGALNDDCSHGALADLRPGPVDHPQDVGFAQRRARLAGQRDGPHRDEVAQSGSRGDQVGGFQRGGDTAINVGGHRDRSAEGREADDRKLLGPWHGHILAERRCSGSGCRRFLT